MNEPSTDPSERPPSPLRRWLIVIVVIALFAAALTVVLVILWFKTDTVKPSREIRLNQMECSKPDVKREYWREYLFITTRTLCEGNLTNTTDRTLHVEVQASIANRKMGEYLGNDTDFVEIPPDESADFSIVLASLTRSEFSLDQVDLSLSWVRDNGGEVPAHLNCENWRNTGSVQIVCADAPQ